MLKEFRKTVQHNPALTPESKSAISATIDKLLQFDGYINKHVNEHDDDYLEQWECDFHYNLLQAINNVSVTE